jgi:proteasome lid subunit RPN8/RPN11
MNDFPYLKVSPYALQTMQQHFCGEYPREACGLLAGRRGTVLRFYPIHNLNPGDHWAYMDPDHVRRTLLSINRRGQILMALCYSRTQGNRLPTPWDVQGVFFDASVLWQFPEGEILVLTHFDENQERHTNAFRIRFGEPFVELEIRGVV